MAQRSEKTVVDHIVESYEPVVKGKHVDLVSAWPVLSGYNAKIGEYKNWVIVILVHTGSSGIRMISHFGEITRAIAGVEEIAAANKASVRSRIEKHFGVRASDAVVFVDPNGNICDELNIMLQKHEFAMGVVPMKIFLSHKGADKPIIREFKKTLELLGFDPWLDEDAMSAGVELERALLKGFADSCAAVFFVTPNYKDEHYLASEVDYAIQEKRKKGERFAIVTLVLKNGEDKGVVPELLHRYVWKEPANELEALREVLKAIPVQTGDVYWKHE